LIEDDPSVRELVRVVLQRCGYNVLEAAQGSQALLIGEQFPGAIDLFIADIVMPKMSGCEVAERLALLRTHMKVLYLSGHSPDTVRRHGVREGRTPILPKPFSPVLLARTVRDALDPAGLAEQRFQCGVVASRGFKVGIVHRRLGVCIVVYLARAFNRL